MNDLKYQKKELIELWLMNKEYNELQIWYDKISWEYE